MVFMRKPFLLSFWPHENHNVTVSKVVPTSVLCWLLLLGPGNTINFAKPINLHFVHDFTVAILLL